MLALVFSTSLMVWHILSMFAIKMGSFRWNLPLQPDKLIFLKFAYFLSFTTKEGKVILHKSNRKRLYSYHFSYSYIPLSTWIPHTPILDWTIQCTLYCTLYTVLYNKLKPDVKVAGCADFFPGEQPISWFM